MGDRKKDLLLVFPSLSSWLDLRRDRLWRAGIFFAALRLTGAGGTVGFLAVGDVPTTTLEVNGGGAHLALNIAAFASSTGGRRALGKGNALFKVRATVMANKFIDWHFV